MIQDFGGRKFILSMTVTILATLLIWFTKIDGETYKYLILVTAGAYMTSNVVQKSTSVEGATNDSTSKAKL